MLIKPGTINFKYVKISELLNEKYYFPIFQRFYAWKDKQISEILTDIDEALDSPDKQIYLLDFIWYEDEGKKYIADGQQRMVTLNLLFLNINQIIDEKKLPVEKIPLFNLEYDWPDYTAKYRQTFEEAPVAPFRKVYLTLREMLRSHNNDEISRIRDILVNRTYVYMRKVSGAETAFSIFSQINTGGKPLSKDEIVKTTIDQYTKMYGIRVQYNFKRPKTLTKSLQGYFKYLRNDNDQFDTVNIVEFLKKDIVETREKFQAFANYVNIVKELESSSIYKIIEYVGRPQLHNILSVMAIKGIDPKNDRNHVQKIMVPLCLLSIVMSMNRANPGGVIRSLYDDIIRCIKEGQKVDDIQRKMIDFVGANRDICTISYEDFVAALAGNSQIRKKLKEALLIIDVLRSNVSSDINMNKINLEHIYPEKPDIEWARHGWPYESEEMKKYSSNIGNFMLLNEEINKKIKNKYIDLKRPEYNKIIPRDKTLQTDMNTVDFDRFENEKKNYIVERQEHIADIIYNNFELAQVMIIKQ